MAVSDFGGSPVHAAPAAGAKATGKARIPPLVLIYMIALFTPMAFTIGPLAMNPLRVYLLIVTPILIVRLLSGKFGPLRLVDGLFFFYLFWVMLALAANNPEMVVTNAGSTSMEFLGGYLVARGSIRDRESFAGFCRLLGIMVIITLIPALWEVFTGAAIVMNLIDAIPGVKSLGDGYFTRLNLQRVQVVFQHPILYGLVCSTAISLTFVAMMGELRTFTVLVRTALVSLATFLALSSGALLAMVLHYFMNAWYLVFRGVERRWTILLILVIIAYFAVDILSTRTPMRVFLTYATFSAQTAYTRLYIFEWGMVNVWANPWLGIGFNDWVRPPFMGASVDNFWLLTTMRYGIPGFLALAGGYFSLIWRVGRLNYKGDAQMLRYRRGWVFTMAGLCFTLTTVHVWSGPYSYMAFLLGAGVWFLAEPARGQGQGPEQAEALPTDPRAASDPVYARPRPASAYERPRAEETADGPVQGAGVRAAAPTRTGAGPVYARPKGDPEPPKRRGE